MLLLMMIFSRASASAAGPGRYRDSLVDVLALFQP